MKRLPVFAVILALIAVTGCSHIPFLSKFSKKSPTPPPPKESSHIATESEKEFRLRWMDKRTSELVSQGKGPAEARNQASAEFAQKFSAIHVSNN